MAGRFVLIVSIVLAMCVDCAGADTLTLFDARGASQDPRKVSDWTADGGAATKAEAGPIEASFPAGKSSTVAFNIPREDARVTGNIPSDNVYVKGYSCFKIPSELCIWSGYSELVLECSNLGRKDLKLELCLEDLTAAVIGMYPREWRQQEKENPAELARKNIRAAKIDEMERTWQGQMHVQEITLKPGDNSIRLWIDGRLRTADGRRYLNVHEIWSVGLRRKAADSDAAVRIEKIWLDGGKEGATGLAGMWPKETTMCVGYLHPLGWYAKMGQLGYSDPNAPFCPFCGEQLELNRRHAEPAAEAADGLRIYPSADAVVAVDSGGGTPIVDRPSPSWDQDRMHLAYYPDVQWDFRGFIRFDLSGVPRGARAKLAQIRLYNLEREDKDKQAIAVYNGVPAYYKPYVPVLQIYQVDDGYADWDEKTLTWLTQPPAGRLLVHGGLYNTLDTVQWFSYDLTSYVNDRLSEGKPSVNLSLRLLSPAPAFRGNIHYWGHHVQFVSRESARRDCCTHLYLELDKAEK